MKTPNLKTYLALIISMLGWAMSFIWFKVALPVYGPMTIVFFRLLISSILLFVFLIVTRKFIIPDKKLFRILLLMAFFEPFLYFVCESYSLKYISSTLAAVIVATVPLFAPIPARFFLKDKERFSGNMFLGAFLSLLGVLLVTFQPGIKASGFGVLLEFLAVFATLGYSTALRKVPDSVSVFVVVFYQSLIGTLYFLPLWLVLEVKDVMAIGFDFSAFMAIAKLGAVGSAFAFILFAYGVRRIGMIRANVFINAIPGFTALFAWMILGESFTINKVIGLVLLFLGLWLAQRKKLLLN